MNTMPTLSDFHLTQLEADSKLWKKVRSHLEGELALLREKNDNPGLNIAETTTMRGEIRLVKRVLAVAGEAGPASETGDAFEDEDAGLSISRLMADS